MSCSVVVIIVGKQRINNNNQRTLKAPRYAETSKGKMMVGKILYWVVWYRWIMIVRCASTIDDARRGYRKDESKKKTLQSFDVQPARGWVISSKRGDADRQSPST